MMSEQSAGYALRSSRRRCASMGAIAAMSVLLMLSGCFDVPAEGVVFINRSAFSVVVVIEGADRSVPVDPQETMGIFGDECLGSGIVVTSEDGDVLAAFDGPACLDTVVDVDENGDIAARDGDELRVARAPVS